MLATAATLHTTFGELRVVSAEGLIGFKSTKADIAHLATEAGISPMALDARDPFEVLDDLMTVVEALCPVWPSRAIGAKFEVVKL